jgi:NTP pyrophosphatase (non-canonical NTP hydrolase)
MEMQAKFDARHGKRSSWATRVTPSKIGVLEHGVVCLLGELGEFANIVKKVKRGDLPLARARPSLTEELTDTFIYLIKLANQLDIDLEATFLERLRYNEERFRGYRR